MNRNSQDEQKTNTELRSELADLRRQLEVRDQNGTDNFTAILQEMSEGVLIVDSQGTVLLANRAAETLLRNHGETLIGTKLELPFESSSWIEITVAGGDGGGIPIELKSSETIWEGSPAFRVLIRDIREQRGIEEALRLQKMQFKAVFDYAYQFALMLDSEGVVLEINKLCHDVCGDLAAGAVGEYVWNLECWKSLEWVREKTELAIEQVRLGRKISDEISFLDKNREVRHAIRTFSPFMDDAGKTVLIAVVGLDVTERTRAEEALREREEVMRYIIKHDPNALAVYDRDLHYIAVSDRYLQDYKVEETDIIGKHHYEVFPEMPKRWKDVHRRVLQGAVEKNDDDYFERLDGSITHNRWECRPWYTARGNIGGMITYTEVTTERKQAELKLIKSEERFRRLAEKSPDVIYRMSLPDGAYEYVSYAAGEIFGYPPQVWYENPGFVEKIIHPDSQAYFKKQWQLLLEGNPPATYEYKAIHKDGRSRWIFQRNVFVRDEDGNIKAIEGIVTDITELKRTEEKLTQQRNLFETMFNTIPDGVIITNTNREILLANRGMEKIFGYREEELQGKTTAMLYAHREEYEEAGAAIFNQDAPSRSDFFHTHYKTKDGCKFPGETFGAKLYDGKNKWIGNLGIMRDVSERERQEQEREQLQNQLLQAQKMESIGTLAGGIAHDFNNILSAILGFSELAKNQLEEGSVIASDLDEVYTAGVRAKDLVRQILAFARQSSEDVKPLQVDMIIKEVIKFLRSSTPVTINIEQMIKSKSLVMGNPTQIHQILMNLCTNAIQALKNESGTITVSLQDVLLDAASEKTGKSLPGSHYIEIKVTDSGEGIAPEHLSQIFEPYFTTKSQGQGTGLGLSVVHGIVESYGGKILVDSTLHEGTTFTIYLPIISGRKPVKIPAMEDLPRGSEHILFVDDEAPITRMGAKMLESLGYEVTIRTSSLEALELFKAKPQDFDLLVTDMTMPNMTGEELAASVKEIRPDLPVILCTGYSTRINEKVAQKRGINGFIYKPVVKADFARLVSSVLDRKNEPTAK